MCGRGVGVEREGVVVISLGVERDFEVAEDGGESYAIGERANLRPFLSLDEMAVDEIWEVNSLCLRMHQIRKTSKYNT